ncbi:MAG TPA: T9SS type A sorting domain-containing protein [Crocinitomix sp.]|nr:T9SS type A sorting domain-containing protein [Crocinitomix sp.]
MNKFFHLGFFILLGFSLNAQLEMKRCGTYEAAQHQETLTPGYLQNINEAFYRAKDNVSHDRATIYTIPVVVHVVYNSTDENIPDSVIFNQIQVLNEAFGFTNTDTVNLRDTFNTIVGSTNIQFELATIGPDGLSTTGITRTQTSITEFGDIGIITGDMSGLERIKSTANGGHDPWDQSRYLNIWVGDLSVFGFTAIMGYATPPANLPNWPAGSTIGMSDGVVIQYQAFGSNNPVQLSDGNGGSVDFRGRTCVHEVGHYLGLRHIWGDGDCTQEDGIDDTPNADANSQTITTCDTLVNTCTDNIGVLGDLPNMQENYMDYSPEGCQVAFTLGQRDLMRGVIENYRWDLIDNYPAVSVDDLNSNSNSIAVFPNPSSSSFQIKGLELNSNIQIFSMNGTLIYQTISTTSTINIDHLQQGIYIIKITQSNALITKRVEIIK